MASGATECDVEPVEDWTGMKRVLFVDDEPLVLQGMKRMLHSMRGEWDMEFMTSASKALARLAEKPFDVVVSDMVMPEMNGAEFLNQVMKRHPQTVRIIFSGHVDKELVLKCVGSTHQYISKPCEPEVLKGSILRASSLVASLQNETLLKLVSRMDRLPSIPSLYTEIIEVLEDPETSVDEAGAIIARDIGMTAKILKLVNSAFFGLAREISTPADAALYLGMDTIRSLVLSTNIFSQFEAMKVKNFSLDALVNHSLETAEAAKTIAHEAGAEQKLMDEAFLAGMLHDTGKLILAANFPEPFGAALTEAAETGEPLIQIERRVFGSDHADIGGYLFGLWALPAPVVEAVALHHQPARSPQREFSPLTAVHIANALVHRAGGTACACDEQYLAEVQSHSRCSVSLPL